MMVESPSDIPAILRAVARFLESISDADRHAIAKGTATIELRGRERTTRSRKPHAERPMKADPSGIIQRLAMVTTREEANAILAMPGVSKAALEKIARHYDLPILRSDSSDKLRQKIVESVVGFRINSGAIRGSDAPPKPGPHL